MDPAISAIAGVMKQRLQIPLALLAVLAGITASCGAPPKQHSIDRLYRGLSEPLPRIDPSALEGRRILIDAGHGGHFRGTVGRDGLEEASVNLGVSLYLWGLLREAGADAYMTRSVDRDFLTEEDSSLASDLRTRVAIADSIRPDVLISIHHNAQPKRDPAKNSVETYYRAGDPASLDLAFAVHRHLMRNLGIENGIVRQGNYLILRESGAPAVLGESSYLTNPGVEEKIKLSEVQKLEAEAYFLGLLEYFGRGIPRVTCLSPVDSLHEAVPELVYSLEDDGGAGIDPDGITMTLNGRPVLPRVDPLAQRAAWNPPWDLPNGAYEATLSARNTGGNTSPLLSTRFAIDFEPEFAAFDVQPPMAPAGAGAVRARVRLLDRRGLPVADGTGVRIIAASDTVETVVAAGSIDVIVHTGPGGDAATIRVECRGKSFEHSLTRESDSGPETRAGIVRNAVTGQPVTVAVIRRDGGTGTDVSHAGEFIYRRKDPSNAGTAASADSFLSIEAPGYIPLFIAGDSPPDTVDLTPWFGGALTGLRFVLDPEGGKASTTGIGKLGLSGAHANLQVARYLAGYLRSAGAAVMLTRTNDEVRTPEDIARMTNGFGASRYIEIRHRTAPADSPLVATTYYFPGSSTGSRMAGSVLAAMASRLDVPPRGPFDTVTYPLQQTACPAIVVAPPSIGAVEEELRLAESWYQRDQAYAVFTGVLDHYEVSDSGEVAVEIQADDAAGWRVTIDGTWTLVTGPRGMVRFGKLAPGEYRLHAVKSGRSFGDVITLSPGERATVRFDAVTGGEAHR